MSSWAPGFPLLEHHLHPLHIPAPTTAVCPEAARRTQALLAQGEKAAAASIAVPAFKHIHAGIHSAHTSSTFARAGKEPSADRSSLAALSTEKKQVCSRRINPSTSAAAQAPLQVRVPGSHRSCWGFHTMLSPTTSSSQARSRGESPPSWLIAH